ncbi:universal stress protein [Candidatus Coxiella mudrowiae]|uniref:universal stress protein n=1 Tax=Candidatus Coxiella mudrowiae TaxID=2054173 RepID=UPI0006628B6C|nr:universal stress protein [Candidatus Coxiella mudrowiae]
MENHFKVLLAMDFSSNSRKALQLLKHLFQKFSIDLALIHVIPSFLEGLVCFWNLPGRSDTTLVIMATRAY